MSFLLHCWLLLANSTFSAPGREQKEVADETLSSSSQEWSAKWTGHSGLFLYRKDYLQVELLNYCLLYMLAS